ncbi:MAG TPA: hypothetical protein VG389_08960 [Myxococcota bacterium]|nr:hypothetical protein [Myxococcota bacterium]
MRRSAPVPPRVSLPAVAAGLVFLGLVCAVAPAARAAAPADAERAVLEEAKRHFLGGQELYRGGFYAQALAEFLKARELMPDAAIAFNVALCQEHLGEVDKAVAAYNEYLRLGADPADAPEVRAHVTKLSAELALRRSGGVPAPASARPFLARPALWAVATVGGVVLAGFAATTIGVLVLGR